MIENRKIAESLSVKKFAEKEQMSLLDAQIALLSNEIVPYRYLGNILLFGIAGQIKLLKSRICVIGCGGLGGFICEFLARLGVGNIVIADPDVFNEQNLNRQLFCRESDIGRTKVECAKERINSINSAIEVEIHNIRADKSNIESLIEGSTLCIDALDNAASRIVLESFCVGKKIPLVHGAIGNAHFQAAVIKNKPMLKDLYKGYKQENIDANPVNTAALCAVAQTSEAIKIIIGMGEILDSNELMLGSWLNNHFQIIDL